MMIASAQFMSRWLIPATLLAGLGLALPAPAEAQAFPPGVRPHFGPGPVVRPGGIRPFPLRPALHPTFPAHRLHPGWRPWPGYNPYPGPYPGWRPPHWRPYPYYRPGYWRGPYDWDDGYWRNPWYDGYPVGGGVAFGAAIAVSPPYQGAACYRARRPVLEYGRWVRRWVTVCEAP